MSDAPYNFVPLSPTIVTPEWGDQVSHTRPFPDGISGSIHYTLTALTPILVGGERQGEAPTTVEFYCEKGKPRIPGSSLRGMMRNVLEIATFSRMSLVDDQRNSLRDLSHNNYKNKLTTTTGSGHKANAKGGWLSFDAKAGKWQITPCEYARVEHDDLARYSGNTWWQEVPRYSAEKKYEEWGTTKLAVQFDPQPEASHRHSREKLVYRKAENLGSGKTAGTLVFTGQTAKREIGKSGKKHLEFIFFNEQARLVFEVPLKMMSEFRQIHEPNPERGYKGEEWAYWKSKPRIPVFYLTNAKNQIQSLGLAQMYKLPYTYSTHELIAHTTTSHLDPEGEPDFVQLLFGQDSRFKGRVDFLPAVLQGTPNYAPPVQGVLAAPKSSYYPHYIKQTHNTHTQAYSTAMNEKAEIAGWKRYPSRNSTQPLPVPIPVNLKVQTQLKPLEKDSVFQGRIVFHNLKPAELGALLWALSWGNDKNLCHTIGMAKAYGYGQAHITLNEQETQFKPNKPNETPLPALTYMSCFMAYMRSQSPDWDNVMKTLCGMANPALEQKFEGELRHMTIRKGPGGNEFVEAKATFSYLAAYPQHPIRLDTNAHPCPFVFTKTEPDEPMEQPAHWVDQEIENITTKNNSKPDDALRGKALAEAWLNLSEPLKSQALADIRARWQEQNWWDNPPGKSAKQAKKIYTGEA